MIKSRATRIFLNIIEGTFVVVTLLLFIGSMPHKAIDFPDLMAKVSTEEQKMFRDEKVKYLTMDELQRQYLLFYRKKETYVVIYGKVTRKEQIEGDKRHMMVYLNEWEGDERQRTGLVVNVEPGIEVGEKYDILCTASKKGIQVVKIL